MSNLLDSFINKEKCISVTGLGYVGLPLALEFAKYFKVPKDDKKQDYFEIDFPVDIQFVNDDTMQLYRSGNKAIRLAINAKSAGNFNIELFPNIKSLVFDNIKFDMLNNVEIIGKCKKLNKLWFKNTNISYLSQFINSLSVYN